ncbi:type I-E CRISPR-associated protein Cse1/CasA [Dietzia sp. 179-F 9C3 NHS]|uniref:type I-E CRISPR-associated protein Cse1/CasA n=1 Tax=Dietzia sp. 179-F 9C3 NHS TaxID=3374295 RepID=UPI00387938EE
MNLVDEPWIPVVDHDGSTVMLGLAELAARAGTVRDVCTGNVLEDAAIWRLLLACDHAAGGDLPGWLAAHADRFNLFDADRPFAQHPGLAPAVDDPLVFKPVTEFMYDAAGGGTPAFLDHRHNAAGVRLTPAEAARLLLVRQQFSLGGIQPMPASGPLGKTVRHGTLAVGALRPLAMWVAGTVAATLAVNRVDAPTGSFHFTWPDGAQPGTPIPAGGVVDALTWPSRAVMLRRDGDGMVDAMALGQGVPYGDSADPALVPHATYLRDAKSGELGCWKMHTPKGGGEANVRPAWLQALRAWANQDGGILAGDPVPEEPLAIRVTGQRFFQSRYDGPAHAIVPRPAIDRAAVTELLEHVVTARRQVWGRIRSAGETVTEDGGWVERYSIDPEQYLFAAHPLVTDACAGQIAPDEASARLEDLARSVAARAVAPAARSHPQVTAVAARLRKDTPA